MGPGFRDKFVKIGLGFIGIIKVGDIPDGEENGR